MTGNGGGILRFYLPRWEWFRTCSIPPSFNRERNLKFKVIELFSFPWKNRWNREEKPNPSSPIVPHRNGKQKKKRKGRTSNYPHRQKIFREKLLPTSPFQPLDSNFSLKKKKKKKQQPLKGSLFHFESNINEKKKIYPLLPVLTRRCNERTQPFV